MALGILNPIPYYFDLDGGPLNDGFIWYGPVNNNPLLVQQAVFWDAAATIPVTQPIRTINGFPVRAGTPAIVYSNDSVSLLVQDKRERQVFYAASSADFDNAAAVQAQIAALIVLLSGANGAAQIGFLQSGVGAVLRTLQAKARELGITITDFGATAGGTIDNLDAMNAGDAEVDRGVLEVPRGTFGQTPFTLGRVSLTGQGNTHDQSLGSATELRKLADGTQVTMASPDGRVENITLNGNKSAFTGDGLQVKNERQVVSHVTSVNQKGNAFTAGDTSSTNCNLPLFIRPIGLNADGHGMEFNSNAPDVNAGVVLNPDMRGNKKAGIKGTKAIDVVLLGAHLAGNKEEAGLHLGPDAAGWKGFAIYTEANKPAPADLKELEIDFGSIAHIMWGSRQGVTSNWFDYNPPGKNSLFTWEPGLGTGRHVWRSELAFWNPQDETSPYASADLRAYLSRNGINVYNLKGTVVGTSGSRATLGVKVDGGAEVDAFWAQSDLASFPIASGTVLIGKTAMGTSTGIELGDGGGRMNLIQTAAGARQFITFRDASGFTGQIMSNGLGTVTYGTTSDPRLKEKIIDAPDQGALIDAVRVREFERKTAPGVREIGFVSTELQQVFPTAVIGEADAMVEVPVYDDAGKQTGTTLEIAPQMVDLHKLIAPLLLEVQHLRRRVAALEARP